MTEVKLYRDRGANIVKGVVSGHTGYEDIGYDIVCASVSSVYFMALNGIENVLNIKFGYSIDDAFAEFILPDDLNDEQTSKINILLDSMYLFLKDLEEQYPDNIKVTELEV